MTQRLAAGVMACLRGISEGLQRGVAAVRSGLWQALCWLRGADEDGDVFHPCREDLDLPALEVPARTDAAEASPEAPSEAVALADVPSWAPTPASVATPADVKGSVQVTGIKPLHFKGEKEIAAPLLAVAAVIFDREKADWVPNYHSGQVLAHLPDNTMRGYLQLQAWGKKTDVVSDTQLRQLPEEALHGARRGVLCSIQSVSDASEPNQAPVKGYQRVGALKGRFVLRELAPNRTHVTYEVGVDAGVKYPVWLIRAVAGNQASQTLTQLSARVAEEGSARMLPALSTMFPQFT